MTRIQETIDAIFAADRERDVDAFLRLLTEDAVMRVGAGPQAHGRTAIRQLVGGLFAAQRAGIVHRLIRVWADGQMIAVQAEAAMSLRDGRDILLPYVNVLTLNGTGLIEDYRIHIDLSPLESK